MKKILYLFLIVVYLTTNSFAASSSTLKNAVKTSTIVGTLIGLTALTTLANLSYHDKENSYKHRYKRKKKKEIWVPGYYKIIEEKVWVPGYYKYYNGYSKFNYHHSKRKNNHLMPDQHERIWIPGYYKIIEKEIWIPGYWKKVHYKSSYYQSDYRNCKY